VRGTEIFVSLFPNEVVKRVEIVVRTEKMREWIVEALRQHALHRTRKWSAELEQPMNGFMEHVLIVVSEPSI
jgi:hypothetical protein